MKKDKSVLKTYFETGDKPTQQQYGDLIDSYVDSKQPAGEPNRRFVIDESGEVLVAAEVQESSYELSSIIGNKVALLKNGSIVSEIDLSLYIDDSNLPRIVSGNIDGNGVVLFKRDDGSSFQVDFSNLITKQIQADWNQLDNTKEDYIKNKTNTVDIPIYPEDYQKQEDVIELNTYVSELYSLQGKPSFLSGFTELNLGGNVYPASEIEKYNPTYLNTPVEFSKGAQPLDSDSKYWFSIIERIVKESREVGINFPDAKYWSYFIGNTKQRFHVKFYVPINSFSTPEDASSFLSKYVGVLTDNPDLPVYVRGIVRRNNYLFTQRVDKSKAYYLRKTIVEGVEDVSRRIFLENETLVEEPVNWSYVLSVPEYTLSNIVSNKVSLLKDGAVVKEIDLSSYLDDSNLARLTSGTIDSSGIATFKRDDDSSFTVDFNNLFSGLDLQQITTNGDVTSNDLVINQSQKGKGNVFVKNELSRRGMIYKEDRIVYSNLDENGNIEYSLSLYPGPSGVTAGGINNLLLPVKSGTVALISDIPQAQAGANITIDNSNPLRPVISSNNSVGGATDLSFVSTTEQGIIQSSSGADATIPVAGKSNAGLMKANFYEEGEWEPVISKGLTAGTVNSSFAKYARNGNLVYFSLQLSEINTENVGGGLNITLPPSLPAVDYGSINIGQFVTGSVSGVVFSPDDMIIEARCASPDKIWFYDQKGRSYNIVFKSPGNQIIVSGTYLTNVMTL